MRGARGIPRYPRKPHGERWGRKRQGAATAQAPGQAVRDGPGAVWTSLGHWGPEICCLTAPDIPACLAVPCAPHEQVPAPLCLPSTRGHRQAESCPGAASREPSSQPGSSTWVTHAPGPTSAPWIGRARLCLRERLCTLPSTASLPAKTGKGDGTGCRQPLDTTTLKGPGSCISSSHFGWKHRV